MPEFDFVAASTTPDESEAIRSQAAEDAATRALGEIRRNEVAQTGIETGDDATLRLQYLELLNRSRASRGLEPVANIEDAAFQIALERDTATGVGGGIVKGAEAGINTLAGLGSLALQDPETAGEFFQTAGQRASETEGLPAELAAGVTQAAVELAPTLGAGRIGAGAARVGMQREIMRNLTKREVAEFLASKIGQREVARQAGRGAIQASATMAGVQGGAPKYFQSRRDGKTHAAALLDAAISGGTTAAVTRLFGLTGTEAILDPAKRAIAGQGLKELAKKAFNAGIAEVAEEEVDQILQIVIEAARSGQNPTVVEVLEELGKTAFIAFTLGSSVNLVGNAKQSLSDKLAQAAVKGTEPTLSPEENAKLDAAADVADNNGIDLSDTGVIDDSMAVALAESAEEARQALESGASDAQAASVIGTDPAAPEPTQQQQVAVETPAAPPVDMNVVREAALDPNRLSQLLAAEAAGEVSIPPETQVQLAGVIRNMVEQEAVALQSIQQAQMEQLTQFQEQTEQLARAQAEAEVETVASTIAAEEARVAAEVAAAEAEITSSAQEIQVETAQNQQTAPTPPETATPETVGSTEVTQPETETEQISATETTPVRTEAPAVADLLQDTDTPRLDTQSVSTPTVRAQRVEELNTFPVNELRAQAAGLEIPGRSTMTQQQLADAIADAELAPRVQPTAALSPDALRAQETIRSQEEVATGGVDPADPQFPGRAAEQIMLNAYRPVESPISVREELDRSIDGLARELATAPEVTDDFSPEAVRNRVAEHTAEVLEKNPQFDGEQQSVSVAKGIRQPATLYQAPDHFGGLITEYKQLHQRGGRIINAERRLEQLNAEISGERARQEELEGKGLNASAKRRQARISKLEDSQRKAQDRLRELQDESPISLEDRQRLQDLNAMFRSTMSEMIEKDIREVLAATPVAERQARAVQLQTQMDRVVEGGVAEWNAYVRNRDLVSPTKLEGNLVEQYMAKFDDGRWAIVRRDASGNWRALNEAGEVIKHYSVPTTDYESLLDEISDAELSGNKKQAQRKRQLIQDKMEDENRSLNELARARTPFLTAFPQDLIQTLQDIGGVPAEVKSLARDTSDTITNVMDFKDRTWQAGAAPAGPVSQEITIQEGDASVELLANRLVLRGTNSSSIDFGDGVVRKNTAEVSAAEFDRVAAEEFGQEALDAWKQENIPKWIVQRNGKYQASDLLVLMERRVAGTKRNWDIATNQKELAEGDNAGVRSAQELIEKISSLFNVGLAVGKTGGVSDQNLFGVYNAAFRLIALKQYDVTTFGHELFHAVGDAAIRGGMLTDPQLQDLQRLATDTGMANPTDLEGAAEFGAIFINGGAFKPAGSKDVRGLEEDYPVAYSAMIKVMDNLGIRDRMEAARNAVVQSNNATPAQRFAARIKLQKEKERSRGFTFGKRSQQAKWNAMNALVDKTYAARAAMKFVLGTDRTDSIIDDAYHQKQLESGWAAAAADQFANGFIQDIRTADRSVGMNDVFEEMSNRGIEGEQIKELMAYSNAMNILDRNPFQRRQLLKNDENFGNWAANENIEAIADIFESVEEIEQDNLQTIKRYRQLVKDSKAAGVPVPPAPYLWGLNTSGYKAFDPELPETKDASQANPVSQDSDYDAETIRGAADIVSKHDLESDFAAVNDKLQEFHMAFDDWRVRNGDLTATDLARHRMINYYSPQRTQLEHTRVARARGTTGDWIDPIEATVEKVMSAFERRYRNASTTAWFRTMWQAQLDAGPVADERGNLQRFMQVRSGDQARISELAKKGQLSEDTENLILTSIDRTTADFIINAGIQSAQQSGQSPVAGIAQAVSAVINVPTKGGAPTGRVGDMIQKAASGDTEALVTNLMGKQIIYRIEDPQVFRALSREAIAWSTHMSKWMTMPAEFVRKAATTLNPEFLFKTFIRTPLESFVQSEGNLAHRVKSIVPTTLSGIRDTWKASFGAREVTPALARFIQTGAPGSSFFTENMNVLEVMSRTDLNKALSRYAHGDPRFGWLRKGLSVMERLSDVTEQSNRLAQFNRIVQEEMSNRNVKSLENLSENEAREILERAGRAAQEVNINFARSGTVGAQLNSMIPFFNAAIQGTRRGIEVLFGGSALQSRSPAQRAKAAAFVFGMLFVPALFQHMVLQDDEDKEEFDDLPDSAKRLFWFIPAGKDESGRPRFAQIPKPPGILSAVSTAYQEMFALNPREWNEIGEDIFAESVPSTFLPLAFQIPIDLMTGVKMELGTGGRVESFKPVVPARLENISPDLQDAPWTSVTAYMLHDAIASVVGEESAISPSRIDHMFNSYTGGIGMLATDVPEAVANAAGWKDRASYDAGDVPFARVLMARDPNWSRRTITRFYDTVAATQPARDEFRALERRVQENRMTAEEMTERLEGDPELKFALGVNDALSDVRTLFGQARTAWERINNDSSKTVVERKQEMDQLLERILSAASKVVEEVDQRAIEKSVAFPVPRRKR